MKVKAIRETSKAILMIATLLCLAGAAGAQVEDNNVSSSQALTTTQMIPSPKIYGPIFVGGAKVQSATGDFNPAIKLLQVALDISTDEVKALEGVSLDVKNADDEIEADAHKINRRDPDFQNKFDKVLGGKSEKYLQIKSSFRGNKLDRFNYLFKASEVYHLPRLVSPEEVTEFAKKVRQDVNRIGNQIGLNEKQSAKLAAIIAAYYSHMGHCINDVAFLQDYVGPTKSDDRDRTIKGLDRLVSQAKDIKKKSSDDLSSLLNKEQAKTIKEWLGWTAK